MFSKKLKNVERIGVEITDSATPDKVVAGVGKMRRVFNIGILITMLAILSFPITAQGLSNSGGGNWQYYRSISVNNNGGGLTDYQVLVNLTDSNFPVLSKSDGSDIRFVDESGAELNYWIESWDYTNKKAKIWVKVTNISANSNTILTMYYGNPAASSVSNGNNTFAFFDDFTGADGSSPDVTKWSMYTGGGGIADIRTNTIRTYIPCCHGSIGGYATSKTTFVLPVIIEFWAQWPDWGNDDYLAQAAGHATFFGQTGHLTIGDYVCCSGDTSGWTIWTGYSTNKWYHFRWTITNTTFKTEEFINGNSDTHSIANSNTTITFGDYSPHSGHTIYYDNVLVRSYTSPEPTVNISSTQTALPHHNLEIVNASISKSIYAVNETVRLSSSIVNENLTSVSADSVRAEIQKPDGITDIIQLNESDLGNYSGIFENTSLAGKYNVIFYAEKADYVNGSASMSFEAAEPKLNISYQNILTWKGANKTFDIKITNTGSTDIEIENIDADISWINAVSTMPSLNPNDEKSISFTMEVPNDAISGQNSFSLKITTSTGAIFNEQFGIYTYDEPTSFVDVKVIDNQTKSPIPNAMLMIGNDSASYYTDSNGMVYQIKTSLGSKTIYGFAKDYLPNYTLAYLELGNNSIELALNKGQILITNVTTTRLNETEIKEAGIDLADTENYWVYNFSADLKVRLYDLTEYDIWFDRPVITSSNSYPGESGPIGPIVVSSGYCCYGPNNVGPGGPSNSGPSNSEYSNTETTRPSDGGFTIWAINLIPPSITTPSNTTPPNITGNTYAFIIIPGQIKLLKEFFSVSVIVTNSADSTFSVDNTTANLILPEGLTLVKLREDNGSYQDQDITKHMGNIPGGSQNGTEWIVRGDKEGNYTITVNINGMLTPFGIPVNSIGTSDVRVYGKPNLKVTFLQSRYVRKGLPFTYSVGVKNLAPIPVHGVTIELFNEAFENVTLDDEPLKTLGTINSGETRYAFYKMTPKVSGFIILDQSFIAADPNLQTNLSFNDDTPEGTLTSFLIVSKEVVNSEVHAFSGVRTEYNLAQRVTSEDIFLGGLDLLNLLYSGYRLATISQEIKDAISFVVDLVVTADEYSTTMSNFMQSIQNDHGLDTIKSESDLLDHYIDNTKNTVQVPLPEINSPTNYNAIEISNLFNDKHANTITQIRTANLSDYTFNKDIQFRNLIYGLQGASRQDTVLVVPGSTRPYRVGTTYVTLFGAEDIKNNLDTIKNISQVNTYVSTGVNILLITGVEVPIAGLVLTGIGFTTWLADISNNAQLSALVGVSGQNYVTDLENLYYVYFRTTDWIDNTITLDSAQSTTISSNQMVSSNQMDYQSAANPKGEIVNLETPDIIPDNNNSFGYAIGNLTVSSYSSTAQNLTGNIAVRYPIGNSIIQLIDIQSELLPNETKVIPFNYTGFMLPGFQKYFVVESYLKLGDNPLEAKSSTFKSRMPISNSTDQVVLLNGSLSEREAQYTNFTLPQDSESFIVLSFEHGDVDLHLTDSDGNHVGLNYSTGAIDSGIPGVIYSGSEASPEWILVRNPNLRDIRIGAFSMEAPEGVNYSVTLTSSKVSDVIFVNPLNINTTVYQGNVTDIPILIENMGYNSTDIINVSTFGNITELVSHISYPAFINGGITKEITLDINAPRSAIGKHYNGTVIINTTFQTVEVKVDIYITTQSPDTTPPTTNLTLSGSFGNNSWYISNVQVNLTATDNESGSDIAKTEYRLNGAGWVTYNGPFTISDEGTTTIEYNSTDSAGNVEVTMNRTINIDKTPPVITGNATTLPNVNGWYNNSILVNFTASDALSGIDTITPDTTISTEGINQSITGTATDKAGNNASFTVSGINIDKTPPNVTVSRSSEPNANGWNNETVIVIFNASDILSGIDGTSTGTEILSSEGANQGVTRTFTDKAGNSATVSISDINIDLTPPNITGAPTTSPNTDGWYNTDVTVHFTANDALSGIDAITPDTITSMEGVNQSITGTAIDKAGNNASFTVTGINIDRTPPQIIINSPMNGSEYILNQTVLADWSAYDSLSGIASATGTVPDGLAIDTGIVGTKEFNVTAIDNASNTASQNAFYTITYNYLGILPPIRADNSSIFKSGSTVLVKFRIVDANGNNVSTAVANLTYQKITNDILGTIEEPYSTGAADSGNTFRYDDTNNLYIFNLDTSSMDKGTYQLNINLDDGTIHIVDISIRP